MQHSAAVLTKSIDVNIMFHQNGNEICMILRHCDLQRSAAVRKPLVDICAVF
eukprot:m.125114 g.125114  ORF g.125114 m.125114 type:complete len:52 (+) comp9367_c0_seq2:256-411(+)